MQLKALLIEPSKLYEKLFSEALQSADIEVDTGKTGQQGQALLKICNYDFIFMSMQLPDCNGIDLCMQFRQTENTANTPIIIATSDYNKGIVRHAFYAGATDVLNKRNPNTLIQYIENLSYKSQQSNTVTSKILYVEDSMSIALTTIAVLEDANLEVDHFIAAEDGLIAFNKNNYDLVITDILLEGNMQGNGFVRAIRQSDDYKRNIPILAVSGLKDTARKVELLKAGANDFIGKPILYEEFLARTHNLLYSKQLLDKVIEQKEQIYELAIRDNLTGLYNRNYLAEASKALIDDARRHNFPVSLIITDIDFFKKVNDQYGHQTGDNVLVAFSKLLQDETRSGDFSVRYGGEEFIILLSHCPLQSAVEKAEAIREKTLLLSPDDVSFSASFGVSTLDISNHEMDLEQLIKIADNALYSAKESGRNCVIY